MNADQRWKRRQSYLPLFVPLTLGLVTILVATGWTASETTPSLLAKPGYNASINQAAAGGTLTMARIADIFTLDPATAADDRSVFTLMQIYDRLVKLSPNGKTVEPELSTSWKFSNGGKTAVFTLRRGVKFSDGSPLTSADVVTSLNRARAKNFPWAFFFSPVTSVSTVNVRQVKISLAKPFAPLLSALATFAASVYSSKNLAKYGPKIGTHPLGTGAFLLQKWNKGSDLTLVRNNHYWQKGKPTLDKIVFRVVGDDNARVLQLDSGSVDVIDSVPANQVQAIKAQGNAIQQVNGSADTWLVLNLKKEPAFKDRNVRCALAYSVDRATIARQAYFGTATVARSLIPSSTFFYDGNQHPFSYDFKKAKAFLSKSKFPKGFTFHVDVDSGDSPGSAALQVWAGALQKLGINMKIDRLEATTTQDRFQKEQFTARYVPWTNDTPDPDEMMGASLDWKSGQDGLFTNYQNPKVRALVLRGRQELNPIKRQAIYSQVQRLTNADCAPFIYVVNSPRLYATTQKIHGFAPNSQGKYSFESVTKS